MKRSIRSTLLAALLLIAPSFAADLVQDPLAGSRQGQDLAPFTTPMPDASATLSLQSTFSTRSRTSSRANNGTTSSIYPTPTYKLYDAKKSYEENRRSSNLLIGGLMILIVGLLGPLVLWCWIRKRRQQEEAEFAIYMLNRPPTPPSRQLRPRPVEMQHVQRPISPSGVPPPPTYQEAVANGRIPEQPK